MSFHEKSSWCMGILLAVTGGFFLKLAVIDGVPAIFAAIPFILFVVFGSLIVQIVLALTNLQEASSKGDERDSLILDRAGHLSSYFLGLGVLLGLGQFMLFQDGNTLFLIVLTALILSHIVEYGAQVFLYRKGL